jgi:hypothetical protein
MHKHFYLLKNTCPGHKRDIELTEEIKQYILKNRIYSAKIKQDEPIVTALQKALMFYKNRKDERFFQIVLEDALGGSHKHLSVGVTDITTDTYHGEIKEWKDWKSAIGQLMAYNFDDPKPELRMYLFGRCNRNFKESAIRTLQRANIKAYECLVTESGVSIVDLYSNTEEMFYPMVQMESVST